MDINEITARIELLSPEARALFLEVGRRGEEYEFHAPPFEVLDDELLSRINSLPGEDQREFFGIFGALARYYREEGLRLQAEGIRAEGFAKLIERAQELDRRAGRPVNESMTLKEAVPKLEAAGELDTLDREYLNSVWGELVWVPVPEEE
jgi:hypothetical protein